MPEQENPTNQEPPKNPMPQELGDQGNTGQYGQGQYDSEGKPDALGPQAQRIQPTQPQNDKNEKPTSHDPIPLQDLQNQQNA